MDQLAILQVNKLYIHNTEKVIVKIKELNRDKIWVEVVGVEGVGWVDIDYFYENYEECTQFAYAVYGE